VDVGKVSGEDSVDELVGEVGEDEPAFRLLRVLDGLDEADDACVQRVHGEPDDAETTARVAPRQVRQLLTRVHTTRTYLSKTSTIRAVARLTRSGASFAQECTTR